MHQDDGVAEYDVLVRVTADRKLSGDDVADLVGDLLDRGLEQPGADDIPELTDFEIQSTVYAGDIRLFLANMTQIGWAIESGDIPQIAQLWEELQSHPLHKALGDDHMPSPWLETFLQFSMNFGRLQKAGGPYLSIYSAIECAPRDSDKRLVDVLSDWADEITGSLTLNPETEHRLAQLDEIFVEKCGALYMAEGKRLGFPEPDLSFLRDFFCEQPAEQRERARA